MGTCWRYPAVREGNLATCDRGEGPRGPVLSEASPSRDRQTCIPSLTRGVPDELSEPTAQTQPGPLASAAQPGPPSGQRPGPGVQ